MTAAPLLSVRDLSVCFRHGGRETLAVDRVSFDIAKGETVALVGESGSGKSVTALSILKLLPYPAARHPSGSDHVQGPELLPHAEREMQRVRGDDITIMFQEPMTSLNPLHTIEKQIGEILLLHRGLTGAAARARTLEMLTQVGIPDPQTRLKSYPHQLSGGQRQRVMIAMALANEPDLLIADEPTTALDVTVQAQIIALLKDMQKRLGMSLLFITHDLGIVRKIADRVCVMKEGKIVEQGDGRARVHGARASLYARAACRRAEARSGAAAARRADGGARPTTSRSGFRSSAACCARWSATSRRSTASASSCARARRSASSANPARARPRSGCAHPAADLLGRADRVHGQQAAGPALQGDAAVPPRHADRVPGSVRLAVAAHVGRRDHQGRAEGPPSRHAGTANASAGDPGALPMSGSTRRRASAFPHEFSGGQRQRIAVARAIVLEPTFVVLDEPTSALDMLIQSQMVDLLRDLQKRHDLTYLFISHDLRVVAALASRLMVMRARQGGGGRRRRRAVPQSAERLHARAVRRRVQSGDGARGHRRAMSMNRRSLAVALFAAALGASMAAPAVGAGRDRSHASRLGISADRR